MPSQRHEALLLLFRNRPELAPELLRQALHVELPKYTEARIESAELTDIQPAEYRADLVVLLHKRKPVLGIVVEVQLSIDDRKRFAWPMYVVGLRARIKCPVCLLVVSPNDNVAQWAAEPISLGGHNKFSAMVLRSAGVPIIEREVRVSFVLDVRTRQARPLHQVRGVRGVDAAVVGTTDARSDQRQRWR